MAGVKYMFFGPGATIDDSDIDAFYDDGFRILTYEEQCRHQRQIIESEGFEVEEFPNVINPGLLQPRPVETHREEITKVANYAIELHNNQNGTNLELVTVNKCNAQVTCPMDYYLTLAARDNNTNEVHTYQVKFLRACPFENSYLGIFRRA